MSVVGVAAVAIDTETAAVAGATTVLGGVEDAAVAMVALAAKMVLGGAALDAAVVAADLAATVAVAIVAAADMAAIVAVVVVVAAATKRDQHTCGSI